jgi:hypothetical protein
MGLFGSKKSDKYKRDRHGYDRFGFDADGYDKDGYDVQGYDRDRCDRTGFDIQGYNKKGFNIDGFDFYGFDVNGYDKKGYDKDGFDRDEINKITGTKFDQHRCDKDGYDKDGFDFYGFDVNGYDKKGYDKDGFDRDGLEKVTGIGFDVDGYDQNGYDKDGYYRDGYNKKGYDVDGYDKKGYDKDGYNKNGFDKYIAKDFELTSTFSKITSSFDSDFTAVIAMTYDEPTKMKSKLFFSNDEKMGIYSKDFESFSNNNVVHFHIETAGKQSNAAWIKPKDTGKTQGDNFEAGYTLIVSLNKNDSELNSFLIKKLGKINFGCLPSEYSLLCHLDENYPTDERAKELLQEVVELFNC